MAIECSTRPRSSSCYAAHITNQRYLTDQPVVLMGDFNKPLFNDGSKGC
ncbi:hypothetical protein OK016_21240 [Vibrio chagasii]|nr:hypothetical protein [Vibrio chagasii]